MRIARLNTIAKACLAAGLFIAMFSGALAAQALPTQRGFGAAIATDRPVYRPGQPMAITFEVFNHTPAPVRFEFTSGQRYDVVIEDGGGGEVWRWSAGRMFTMALGRETLGPGNPRLIYETEYAGRLEPGRYRITGILTDARRQASAPVGVDVR